MTTIVTADKIGSGNQYTLGNFGTLVEASGVIIASDDSSAIIGNGSGIRMILNGTVIAAGDGIELGDQSGGRNDLIIGKTGSVTGGNIAGVMLFNGGSHLNNLGEISGAYAAVWVAANPGAPVVLTNAGTMSGGDEAIYISGAQSVVLTNTGTILGGAEGAFVSSENSTSTDTVHNRGLIIGDIHFSLGADLYDGRGGSIEGIVYGEGDDDTFIAGLSVESFDGGAGNDLLDFSRTAGVRVSLDGSVAGSGVAAGDTYVGIENITGSALGRDQLYGDGAGNLLSGLGGVDLLSGGAGKDTLIGGAGKDVLTGGTGNDVFIFNALSETGDKITDYANVAGNNDTIWINAAAFGGGLAAGPLNHLEFQTSADTVALDTNVRFIFDTVDKTLWYDANGNAAGGLTMVADLQANASLTFADIVLI